MKTFLIKIYFIVNSLLAGKALSGTPSTSIFGYDTSDTVTLVKGEVTVVLENLDLGPGQVYRFYTSLDQDNCPVRFQIWRPDGHMRYRLIAEDVITEKTAGACMVTPHSKILVQSTDKLGFTLPDSQKTCVGYETAFFYKTVKYDFFGGAPPEVNEAYDFEILDISRKFNIRVEIGEEITTTTRSSTPSTTTTITTETVETTTTRTSTTVSPTTSSSKATTPMSPLEETDTTSGESIITTTLTIRTNTDLPKSSSITTTDSKLSEVITSAGTNTATTPSRETTSKTTAATPETVDVSTVVGVSTELDNREQEVNTVAVTSNVETSQRPSHTTSIAHTSTTPRSPAVPSPDALTPLDPPVKPYVKIHPVPFVITSSDSSSSDSSSSSSEEEHMHVPGPKTSERFSHTWTHKSPKKFFFSYVFS